MKQARYITTIPSFRRNYFQHVSESFTKSKSVRLFSSDANGNKTKETISNEQYVLDQVKKMDYESFLVGLLMPEASRRAYFAVRAFNIEIATIKDLAKNPEAARLRMEWWKLIIREVYAKRPQPNPIVHELVNAVDKFSLTRTWFLKIIDKRNQELNEDVFRDLTELENYSEETYSSLMYLGLECLGVKNLKADHVASHIGKAQGLSVLLRATPYHCTKRRCYLPLDLLTKFGVVQEELYRGKSTKGLHDVIYEVACAAKAHLEKARTMEAPKEARTAFLPAVAVDNYLKRLEKANFNIFDASLLEKSPLLPLKLAWSSFRGKF